MRASHALLAALIGTAFAHPLQAQTAGDAAYPAAVATIPATIPVAASAPPPAARTLLASALPASAAASSPAPRALRLDELATVLQVRPKLAININAATSPTTKPDDSAAMNLRSAVFQSLAVSPEVRAAQFRADSFDGARDAARGALLPRIDLRAAVGRGRLESVDPVLGLARKDGIAQLTQVLVDEGARREWRRQGVLAESARRQIGGTESSAALETAGAYLQALQARVSIELSQGYETMLAELLRYVTERAAGGGSSAADRDRVRARVANARTGIADGRAALNVALRNLERLTGQAPDALDLGGPPAWGVPADAPAARELALLQNDDLRAARAEIEASDWERSAAQARFLPKLAVEVSHTRNVNAGGSANYLRDSKAMLVLSVPLLNGGADYAQMRAVTAQREEKRARALGVERKLLQEIEAAYANLDSVAERYASVREELEANRAVVKAYQAQLTAANRSLLDVLDAYQRLYQTQLDLTALVVTETQNHLKVAHLTGSLAEALGSGWTAEEGR